MLSAENHTHIHYYIILYFLHYYQSQWSRGNEKKKHKVLKCIWQDKRTLATATSGEKENLQWQDLLHAIANCLYSNTNKWHMQKLHPETQTLDPEQFATVS